MANSMKMGFKLTNFKEFASVLHDLPASVESRVMGDAVGVAMKPMEKAVKQRARKRTGALRKSITTAVRRYPANGKIVGLMGPDKKARYFGGRRLTRGGKVLDTDRPAKYAHLVEFGHAIIATREGRPAFRKAKGQVNELTPAKIRKGKRQAPAVLWVPAKPFMRPGVAASEGQVVAALSDATAVGMEREHKRQLNKLKRIRKSA